MDCIRSFRSGLPAPAANDGKQACNRIRLLGHLKAHCGSWEAGIGAALAARVIPRGDNGKHPNEEINRSELVSGDRIGDRLLHEITEKLKRRKVSRPSTSTDHLLGLGKKGI